MGQVGAINQSELRGFWDPQMAAILLQSGLGYATGLRMLGFVLAMQMEETFFICQGNRYGWPGVLLGFAAAAALGASLPVMCPHLRLLPALVLQFMFWPLFSG